jgi:hypothetical protein
MRSERANPSMLLVIPQSIEIIFLQRGLYEKQIYDSFDDPVLVIIFG